MINMKQWDDNLTKTATIDSWNKIRATIWLSLAWGISENETD